LNREKLPTVFVSVLFELIAEVKTEHNSYRREGRMALETQTSSEAEEMRTSSGDAILTVLTRHGSVKVEMQL